ncbi:MAG: tRNA 2-thiouridine(34) synthase MnmA [Elusimicrobia bacterium]|nr:tRNA 2-thiouridine(34) synthase MnmA [Elusimicrobiota bacterium]
MKVLVGLSGGVDSAVAAYLLKKQGFDVMGAMMSIWDGSIAVPKNTHANACLGPEEDDIESVKKIAAFLDIPFKIIDCSKEYEKVVLDNFRSEYALGRTPNPCVLCNAYVKFGVLPIAAAKQGISFDKFATGHYARINFNDKAGEYQLLKAKNLSKDQSYFLYRLSQNALSKTLFPLGELTKDEVRTLAKEAGIPVAEKPDSQDFYCGDYNDILKLDKKQGNIIDKKGNVLGKHDGIWNYTIGKRKGLGIGGAEKPLYVIKIISEQNIIVVGEKEDLEATSLIVKNAVWCSAVTPKEPFKAMVKIRHQHTPSEALVNPAQDNRYTVEFTEPQLSITPGQSAVFYNDEIVLGGGVIE